MVLIIVSANNSHITAKYCCSGTGSRRIVRYTHTVILSTKVIVDRNRSCILGFGSRYLSKIVTSLHLGR